MSSPKIVPTVPSEIDWGHPLARGLLSLYLPGISLSDFVANGPTLAGGTAATIAPTPHGPGYADQVINNGAAFAACPAKIKIAGPMTLLLRLYQISTMGGTSGGPLWGVQHDVANGAPFFDLALGSLANGQVFLAVNDGAGGTLFTGFDFACVVGAISNVVGVYLPAGSSSCYINSGLNGTSVATPNQTAFGAADLLTFNPAAAAEFIQPNLASLAGAIWGRALSTDEIAWLDAEPFAMLRPLARRTYFALPTGIQASLIKTAGPATLAGSAAVAIAASLSEPAGVVALASTATAAIAASLAETTASATLASTATVAIAATLAANADPATLAGTATHPINASLTATAGSASLLSSVSVGASGTLSKTPSAYRENYVARRIGARMASRGEPMILRRTTIGTSPVPYRNPPDVAALIVRTGVMFGGSAYLGISGSVAVGRLVAGDQLIVATTPTPTTWTVGVMATTIATDSDGIPEVDGSGNPVPGSPTLYTRDSLAANDAWPAIPVSAAGSPDPAASIGKAASLVYQADQAVNGNVMSFQEMTQLGWTEVDTLGVRIAAYNAGPIAPPKVDDLLFVNGAVRSILTVGPSFSNGVNFLYIVQAR